MFFEEKSLKGNFRTSIFRGRNFCNIFLEEATLKIFSEMYFLMECFENKICLKKKKKIKKIKKNHKKKKKNKNKKTAGNNCCRCHMLHNHMSNIFQ